MILRLVVTILTAYFLGAVNGAIIMSKNLFKKDIRDFGSGNAGLTNAFRVFGTKGAALVLLIDIAKSAAAVFLGWVLIGAIGYPMLGKVLAGLFLIIGHVFPIYYGFRGGRGILSCGIMALMLDWRIGLICWFAFILIILFSRYVSLGSVCSSLLFPLLVALFRYSFLEILFTACIALIMLLKHYDNILRLIAGKESKLSLNHKRSN